MKILVSSSRFWPDVGGIEVVGQLLCREFVRAGHQVRVVSDSEGPARLDGYEIVRRPSAGELYNAVGWADLVFHNNISLKHAWPLLTQQRPWVVTVHTWIARTSGTRGIRDRMKLNALGNARVIAISRRIAESLPVPSIQVPDPYDCETFNAHGTGERRGILSVGRLVSDKGVDLLIDAFAQLCCGGMQEELTIVGDGPERRPLQEQAQRLGIASRVSFAGVKSGTALADEYRRHRVVAVPSRWREPFGIVAIEGIACGCRVVGADDGGLEDAIGAC
jgi:glycogen synthase